MTWLKRGGGSGAGFYASGLSKAEGAAEGRDLRDVPKHGGTGTAGRGHDSQDNPEEKTIAPAYRVTQCSQVRDNKILLDLLAHGVATQGWTPDSSIYYDDAVATFGVTSVHFLAACRGEQGAGAHYQRTVAGGRYRNGEVR